MKTVFTTLAALVFLFPLAARATDPTSSPAKPAPKRGMTRAQILALYGEPRLRGRMDGQETWFYRLKFNEVYGRAIVPFEIESDNVRIGEIGFDTGGKVARYRWNRGAAQRIIW